MKTIGRYEIRGLLGRGGMGAVYKVRLPVLGRIVALKLLDPSEIMADLLGMEEIKKQFLHEARVMASLKHPHIAEVWDYDEVDGKPFFIMEYVCNNLGQALGEHYIMEAPARRLTPGQAVRYCSQLLSGLERMHQAGIVHRDVKPYNLLITGEDRIKIIDFGLSRLRGEVDFKTPRGMKVGSPFYTAPEQERSPESADTRADLFSAGVMLYRMLTGVFPSQVLDGQEEDGQDRLQSLGPDMAGDWEAFFHKALAPDPADRFQSAKRMAAALKDLFEAWKENLSAICGLPEELLEEDAEAETPERVTARSEPLKTGPRNGADILGLDELGRPLRAVANRLQTGDGEIVLDEATGLCWQRSGSDFPMTWDEAHEYVRALNDLTFRGFSDWRLPTVEELATLVPGDREITDFCMDSIFDQQQRIVWSADRRTFMAAWYCNAALGFVGFQDMTCLFHVRAVRTEC